MKILHIFSRYQQYGGEEAFFYQMTNALSDMATVDTYVYSSEELWGNGIISRLAAPLRMWDNNVVAQELLRRQQEFQYDVWIVHNTFPAMSPSVYRMMQTCGVKVIHYVHNYRFGCLNGLMYRDGKQCSLCTQGKFWHGVVHACWRGSYFQSFVGAAVLQRTRQLGVLYRCAHYIAVSQKQAMWLREFGVPSEKLTVIPHYCALLEHEEWSEEKKNVLFIGRLSSEKGVLNLLCAWEELCKEELLIKDRQLFIMGDGPQRASLEQFVEEKEIKNVCFLGFLSTKEQSVIWEKTGLVLIPSLCEETFGLTVLEAWNHLCPVVVSPCGGLPELINEGVDGWVASDGSAKALLVSWRKALQSFSYWQKMGRAGREKIHTQYSLARWRDSIKEVISQACR